MPLAQVGGQLLTPLQAYRQMQTGRELDLRCTDPECGGQLSLVAGRKRITHFRHRSDSARTCAGWRPESVIHRLAKQALVPGAQLLLPAWTPDHLPEALRDSAAEDVRVAAGWNTPSRVVEITEVRYEPADDGFRPDARVGGLALAASVAIGDDTLDIEIHYSHRVSLRKRARMAKAGRGVLEIRVSDAMFSDERASGEAIADAVLRCATNRLWVSHPVAEANYRRAARQHAAAQRSRPGQAESGTSNGGSGLVAVDQLPAVAWLPAPERVLFALPNGDPVSVVPRTLIEQIEPHFPHHHTCRATQGMVDLFRKRTEPGHSSAWVAVGMLLVQLGEAGGVDKAISCESCLQIRSLLAPICVCGWRGIEPLVSEPHQIYIWRSHARIAFTIHALRAAYPGTGLPPGVCHRPPQ